LRLSWWDQNLAQVIVEVTDQLDLRRLVGRYRGRGSAAYHPSVLSALLVYGDTTVAFSSREIERATYDSVAFRFLSADIHPDQHRRKCLKPTDMASHPPALFRQSETQRLGNTSRKSQPLSMLAPFTLHRGVPSPIPACL
jgi:hypothetical protein